MKQTVARGCKKDIRTSLDSGFHLKRDKELLENKFLAEKNVAEVKKFFNDGMMCGV